MAPGNGNVCLPQNTFIADGNVWEDTEKNHKYIAFRKGLRGLLDWKEIDALFDSGITDVISLAEYLQHSDHLTVIKDLSQHWHGPSSCLVDSTVSLKQKFAHLDYFEFLKLLILPKLRNCELKIIALKMSGYEVTEAEMKNIRKKAVKDFFKDASLCSRIKAVAKPTANFERTTIVGKEGDSVTIEIKNLHKGFSFAYAFFRNIEQECRLLKREIEKAQSLRDKITIAYLKAAQLFLIEHPAPEKFYIGGISFPPILEVLHTLSFKGQLIFSNSVALCVKNRIDDEINVIRQEYENCKMFANIISDNIDKIITIIRSADNEEEAIEELQSEMSLTADTAECLCTAPLHIISDKELMMQKIKSMKFLLSYLKHLKTINVVV